jgi:hypothetical protein
MPIVMGLTIGIRNNINPDRKMLIATIIAHFLYGLE